MPKFMTDWYAGDDKNFRFDEGTLAHPAAPVPLAAPADCLHNSTVMVSWRVWVPRTSLFPCAHHKIEQEVYDPQQSSVWKIVRPKGVLFAL